MKTLKIRFVEHIGKSGSKFTMEYKGWFGWRRNTVMIGGGHGSVVYDDIYGTTKEHCLTENLYHMNLCKDFVRIIEYSTVKTY
jgi:hypothetical protein